MIYCSPAELPRDPSDSSDPAGLGAEGGGKDYGMMF